MTNKILITGANRGIGLALTTQLKRRGDYVVAAVRQATRALADLGVRVEEGVDVTNSASLRGVAQRLAEFELDWLICNAGILESDGFPIDEAAIRRQFEVNALGPLRTVAAFAPRLRKGSKIALITSRMGSVADNSSGGMYGYRMSKAALNMAGRSLAHDLRKREIPVVLLHPGYVRTDMTSGAGTIDPDEAARGLIARIDELTLESSGKFWHQNGEPLPW
jgi:NAD(P)-dependent dehydrogenase (short-subunit alcohol dehydrogenase family)